jgi:hypothetical protein
VFIHSLNLFTTNHIRYNLSLHKPIILSIYSGTLHTVLHLKNTKFPSRCGGGINYYSFTKTNFITIHLQIWRLSTESVELPLHQHMKKRKTSSAFLLYKSNTVEFLFNFPLFLLLITLLLFVISIVSRQCHDIKFLSLQHVLPRTI